MSWFSRYLYYFVSYTFQGADNKNFYGNGHMIIQRLKEFGPPTMQSLIDDLESEGNVDEPISLVIVTYQKITKAEYNALATKKKVEEKTDELVKPEIEL